MVCKTYRQVRQVNVTVTNAKGQSGRVVCVAKSVRVVCARGNGVKGNVRQCAKARGGAVKVAGNGQG